MAAPINSWTDFIAILNQLKKDEAKEVYNNVILDTADIAWDLCEKFICQRAGATSINDQKALPFGQGYAQVEKEFDERLRSIIQMDYGLIIISHAEEKSVKDETGDETTKIGPTVNKRAAKVINRIDISCPYFPNLCIAGVIIYG